MRQFLKLDELGIRNIWGGDAASLNDENCKQVSEAMCSFNGFGGQALSIKSLMYFTQLGLAGRMQEPIELLDWAGGQTISNSIELSKIDRVPVSIVHAISDETCDPTGAEYTYMLV